MSAKALVWNETLKHPATPAEVRLRKASKRFCSRACRRVGIEYDLDDEFFPVPIALVGEWKPDNRQILARVEADNQQIECYYVCSSPTTNG